MTFCCSFILMFFFMYTCMDEWPAISPVDFHTIIESRQLDESHKCHRLHHSSCTHTFNSSQFFDHPRLDALSFNGATFTQILNVVLHFNPQGQAVSQGRSSRTATSMFLISIVICRLCQISRSFMYEVRILRDTSL